MHSRAPSTTPPSQRRLIKEGSRTLSCSTSTENERTPFQYSLSLLGSCMQTFSASFVQAAIHTSPAPLPAAAAAAAAAGIAPGAWAPLLKLAPATLGVP